MEYTQITNILNTYIKDNLSQKRYDHSVHVADMCKLIAIKCNMDPSLAFIAGLSHDIAREKDISFLKGIMEKLTGYSSSFLELPQLYHGPVGAYILKNDFNITNQDILDAVSYHSTGKINLANLGKIVFVSDYISFDRNHIDNRTRDMFLKLTIDQMVLKVLYMTREYLKSKGSKLVTESIELLSQLNGVYNE